MTYNISPTSESDMTESQEPIDMTRRNLTQDLINTENVLEEWQIDLKRLVPIINSTDVKVLVDYGIVGLEDLGMMSENDLNLLAFSNGMLKTNIKVLAAFLRTDTL